MTRALLIVMATFALGACASQTTQIRKLPPDTSAPTTAGSTDSALAVTGGDMDANKSAVDHSRRVDNHAGTAPRVTPADAPPMLTYDPWERFNRGIYRFNARFDESIFLPVANGYRFIPSPVRSGVHNFFSNLSEVDSMLNFSLQGRLGYGVRSLGRFVINSTIGIAGLFDVAEKIHIPSAQTGFGTTLAKWGMHPGPYLVLPFLGPSTLRDGFGLLGDFGTSYAIDMGGLYRSTDNAWMLGVANAIDRRSDINFRYYSTGSAFEYETIRFLYVRKLLIEDEGLHANDPPIKRDTQAPAGQ